MLKYLVAFLLMCSICSAGDTKYQWNPHTSKLDLLNNLTRSDSGVVYWGGESIKVWDSFSSYITPVDDVNVELTGDLNFNQPLSLENVVNLGFVGSAITFEQLDVTFTQDVSMTGIKVGTDQANAGAAAGEIYADSNDDYTLKVGI